MTVKILIADDSVDKIKYIKETIEENIACERIDISNSYNSTTKAIKNNEYDLVVLDMSMPTFDHVEGKKHSTPKPLAGKDIMSKLQYRGIELPIIILTQFDVFGRHSDVVELDSLTEDLKSSFPNNFKGCVFYNPQGSEWSNSLVSIIKEILKIE